MVFVSFLLIDDPTSPNHPQMEGEAEPEKTLTFGCFACVAIEKRIGWRVE